MRVLHIIPNLRTGGAQRALHRALAQEAVPAGHASVLALMNDGVYRDRIARLGVPVHTIGMRRGLPGVTHVIRLVRLIRQIEPDVVHGWMYHGNLAASLATLLSAGRVRVVWEIRHSLYSLRREKPLTRKVIQAGRWLSRYPDAIVYNAGKSRRQHEEFGFSANRARVIPNGFDLDALRPSPARRRRLRTELGIEEEELVVSHIARFHPAKDHATFLDAAIRIARRIPNVRFVMAGTDITRENGMITDRIPGDVMSRFSFLGESEDVVGLMQASDIFCQSSWTEAFPNVLGEAMACAVPCVATDAGDTSEIVGDTGSVVPPESPDALVQEMDRILNMTAAQRAAMGSEARMRIESNYAIERMTALYRELYRELGGKLDGTVLHAGDDRES